MVSLAVTDQHRVKDSEKGQPDLSVKNHLAVPAVRRVPVMEKENPFKKGLAPSVTEKDRKAEPEGLEADLKEVVMEKEKHSKKDLAPSVTEKDRLAERPEQAAVLKEVVMEKENHFKKGLAPSATEKDQQAERPEQAAVLKEAVMEKENHFKKGLVLSVTGIDLDLDPGHQNQDLQKQGLVRRHLNRPKSFAEKEPTARITMRKKWPESQPEGCAGH